MIKKTTSEILVETDEVLHISGPSRSHRCWCEECGEEAEMLLPEEAAAVLGTTVREIFRGAEAGEIHFKESIEGLMLICAGSWGTHRGKEL